MPGRRHGGPEAVPEDRERRQRLLPARGHDPRRRHGELRADGFHTVDLPGKARASCRIITPPGQLVAGALDAADAPFWFNGQTALGFNPAAAHVRVRQELQLHRLQGGPQRPAAGEQAEADDGEVHEDRDVPLLLRHPSRDDRHRQGRLQVQEGPFDEGGPGARSSRRPRRDAADRQDARQDARRRRAPSTSAPPARATSSFFAFLPARPDGPRRGRRSRSA